MAKLDKSRLTGIPDPVSQSVPGRRSARSGTFRTRCGGASAQGRTGKRVALDSLSRDAWAARIRATLAHAGRTAKGLGQIQGGSWRPRYYAALDALVAAGAVVYEPPAGRGRRKWRYRLQEAA